MPDLRERIASIFPREGEVPPEFDVGPVEDGDRYLVGGEVRRFGGPVTTVDSPVCLVDRSGAAKRRVLGSHAALGEREAKEAVEAAKRAWANGRGEWPTSPVGRRIEALKAFAAAMRPSRDAVVRRLMWEIGKPLEASEKEFDRTVAYIQDTIEALKELDRQGSRFSIEQGIIAQVRRAPLGVALCMGPFNYPVNESYTTIIPAIAMGCPVVVKLPRFGMLASLPLLGALRDCFPTGVVNVLAGDGKTLVSPIIRSGAIDVLAFIGSAKVASTIKQQHPAPHRLRSVLGLDAKNPAIVLEDADLERAARECVKGALSFSGQRCTAIKLIFVQERIAERFVSRLVELVEALKVGMPWERSVDITPLPEAGKVEKLAALVEDAKKKGAHVANPHGGVSNTTFYFPAVVFPVTSDMELHRVEQFGPIVPVATYREIEEVFAYVAQSPYGQQASVFGRDPKTVGVLVDVLANQVCRINLNAQCQRGPDVFPFTGRKDSAEGTLSVSDALRVFSIRSMVASNDDEDGKRVLTDVLTGRHSRFLRTDFLL